MAQQSRYSAFLLSLSKDELRRRRVFRVGALMLILLAPGSWAHAQDIFYDHPDAARVSVHSEVVPGRGITVDLYFPPATQEEVSPVVIFVLAYPDSRFGPLKNLRQYKSWARLVAAEGFVGVLYETSEPEADLESVFALLREQAENFRIDLNRIGLWSCSANTALALKHARTSYGIKPAAFVAYYGLMPTPDGYQAAAIDSMKTDFGFSLPKYNNGESYRADLPMLLVRAGRDRYSVILNSIDRFAAYAFQQNLQVTVLNYPEGQHAFDVKDDTAETRAIIKQTLDFFRTHLGR